MEYDPTLLRSLRDDLEALTELHGPSGAEQPVIARLRELFAPLVDSVAVDHMGNLTAVRDGVPGAPHLVVSAHADEIGAQVASVDPAGFLRLRLLGGAQPRMMEGRAVWVAGRHGVIGARSGHLTSMKTQRLGARMEDLYVDVGVDDAAGVETLGIRVGDPVVVLSELRDLAGTRVAGKALDNRASCVALLHVLRRLQGQELPCRLTVLVSVQEEVGLRGAAVAYARLQPDLAVVLDTTSATGTPDTSHLTDATRIGNGVVIHLATQSGQTGGRGYLVSRAICDAVIAAAGRADVPYQLRVSSGGGGVSDATAAHVAGVGVPTMDLAIPRRYSHSPVELLDLRDLAAAVCLVEEIALHPPSSSELAFIVAR
jgi:putative aminopeptidase